MALTDSLISVWELNEASGNAIDSHGSNDLTETSGLIDASGDSPSNLSGSRDFESIDTEYFARADNADLSTGDIDFTIAAWVKAESFPGGSGEMDILSKYETVGNQREYRIEFTDASDRFVFWVSSNGSSATSLAANSFGAPSIATWYHLVAWHDSVNNVIGISVNGTSDTTAYSSGVLNGTSPFHIGALGRASATFFWDGLIAQAALWKRVLTSTERSDLYNGGAGLPYSSWGGGAATNRRRRLLIAGRAA